MALVINSAARPYESSRESDNERQQERRIKARGRGKKRRVNERHKERINNREVICRRLFFVLICAAEDQL